jgi:hypothetical protein
MPGDAPSKTIRSNVSRAKYPKIFPVKSAIATTALLLLAAAIAVGQNASTQPRNQTGAAASIQQANAVSAAPCLFNFERGEVPDCLRKSATGDLFVAPQILKEITFDSYGLAAVLSPADGWMYASREGKILITGVPMMDNAADTFHDGLVRTVRNEKYGFANREGQLVIPAIYDGATNFSQGHAKVCQSCRSKCVDFGCEYHVFSGGEWFEIDAKGNVLGRVRQDN